MIFDKKGSLKIIESHLRIAGGSIPTLIEYTFGYNLNEIEAKLAKDLIFDLDEIDCSSDTKGVSAVIFLLPDKERPYTLIKPSEYLKKLNFKFIFEKLSDKPIIKSEMSGSLDRMAQILLFDIGTHITCDQEFVGKMFEVEFD